MMKARIVLAGVIAALMPLSILSDAHGQEGRDGSPPARATERGIDLRPRFERGQEMRYRLELTNTSRIGGGPAAPRRGQQPTAGEMKQKVEFGLLLRVKDVNKEGEAAVDMVLESLRLRIDALEGTVEFDSAAPGGGGDEFIGAVLKSIVGTTMTATIDRSGNIQKVTGGEALAMLGQTGLPAGGSGGAGPRQLFDQILSLKHHTGFAHVGETWENEDVIDSPLLGRMKLQTQHTLARMQGRDAVVNLRGRMMQDSASGTGRPVNIRHSEYSGNYVWDTAAGSLKELYTAMTVRAETTVGDETVETTNESAVRVSRQQ